MDSIGKYEILEKIGTGGFGTVFKAYDPFIKRFVAIKTCTTDEEEVRKRFFQEAEISGNLQHRNVVTVYDFGTQGDVPYLIQEFLSGEDLDRKIKRKDPISNPEKVLFLVQIARGLEYAHSKGVIHRDVKPANIRILEDGTAKIMDFGIAKLAQRQSGLTQTGMTLGTAAYLAPEQIRGEKVDPRTDIFSFGVLAYELITGERPFVGEAISGVLYQILNAKPRPLTASWTDCPPEMARMVERCLEKDPAKRYPSCSELLRDLDVILRRLRTQRRPSDEGLTTSANMRHAATSAIRQMPDEPSAPTSATVVSAAPEKSGEIDLTYHRDPHQRTPRSISTTAAYRENDVHWGRWAALLALLVAAGGGWWYYQQTRPGPPAAQQTAAAQPPPASQPAAVPPPAPVNPAPEPAAVETPPATAPEPAAEQPPAAAAPEPAPPPVVEEPPPAPEPPKPGTLTIARAWSPDITVTVDGGPARRLDRDQRIDNLAPGKHVLSFEIISPEYTDSSESQITLKAGERRRIQAPLQRPGQLNVQAQINSPQGLVRVKGESWGQSPIRGRKLRPGPYRVEILPLQAEAGGGVTVEVNVTSGIGTTVTFNLARPEMAPQIHESNIGS